MSRTPSSSRIPGGSGDDKPKAGASGANAPGAAVPPASPTPQVAASSQPQTTGVGSSINPPPRGFERRPAQPTMHPRRVVGGVKLQTRGIKNDAAGTGAEGEPGGPPAASIHWTWASARWMRIAEQFSPGDQLVEGLEYAKMGQTRQLEITPGTISARVQGRMPQAYRVMLRMPTFSPEQWDAITGAMTGQAKYVASLLASELPPNIEDLFAPLGLHLFPPDLSDLSVSCDCDVFRRRLSGGGGGSGGASEGVVPKVGLTAITSGSAAGVSGAASSEGKLSPASKPAKKGEAQSSARLCKHICCTMYLVAEKLAQQGLLIFTLRGLSETDLLERLRTQRAIAGLQRSGGAAAPVYTPHLPIVAGVDTDLSSCVHDFWSGMDESGLEDLDMPIEPPPVTHPLLRRMGASPLSGAKFPLVGLLATCYDVISEKVIREAEGGETTQG